MRIKRGLGRTFPPYELVCRTLDSSTLIRCAYVNEQAHLDIESGEDDTDKEVTKVLQLYRHFSACLEIPDIGSISYFVNFSQSWDFDPSGISIYGYAEPSVEGHVLSRKFIDLLAEISAEL